MKVESLTLPELNQSSLASNLFAIKEGIFLNPLLLTLWEKVYRWKFLALTDGRGLFAGFVKTTLLGKILYSLPFGWYGGFQGSLGEEFVCAVLGRLESERFLEESIVQFTRVPFFERTERYQRRVLTTCLLELSPVPRYSTNTVRNLKKAGAHSLDVRMLSDEHFSRFLDSKIEHERRTGERRRVNSSFYEQLFNLSLEKESSIEIYGAFAGAELIGCQLYFANSSSLFYFDGFSSVEGLEKCSHFLLTDHVIKSAQQRGKKILNFGSSPAGDLGLERFKSGWGATLVTYQEYHRVSRLKRAIDRCRGRK